MKQLLLLNPESASEEDVKKYPVREAAHVEFFDRTVHGRFCKKVRLRRSVETKTRGKEFNGY